MTANKPMTSEQLDELMTVAVNMQRDSEKAGDRPAAMFAYAVQVAALELRNFRNDAAELKQKLIESERYGRQTDITIDNLEMKLKSEREAKLALAAELNAVEAIHTEAVFITDDHYEQCPPQVQKMIRSLAVLQIPAYQAFLAEVRAQGVEMLRKHPAIKLCSLTHVCDEFAAQLRKGAQS